MLVVGGFTLVAGWWAHSFYTDLRAPISLAPPDRGASPTFPDALTSADCPAHTTLVGLPGEEQWCSRHEPDGTPVKHGPYRRWHRGCGPPNREKCTIAERGTYRDNGLEGDYTTFHPNGQISQAGQYQNGQRHGLWRHWHPNGQVSLELTEKAGFIEGRLVRWHPNGRKEREGDYRDNEKTGTWRECDERGRCDEVEYREGHEQSRRPL